MGVRNSKSHSVCAGDHSDPKTDDRPFLARHLFLVNDYYKLTLACNRLH